MFILFIHRTEKIQKAILESHTIYLHTRIDMVELICKAEYLYDFSRLPDPTVLFCVKICFSFLNNVNIKIKLFTACFLFLKLTLKKGSYQSFRIRHQNSDHFFL
jgi:hypothetical protein